MAVPDISAEELVAEINKRGLRVNTLFQLDDFRWQASVRDPNGSFWEFGRGKTLVEALHRASCNAPKTTEAPAPAPAPPPQPEPGLFD